MSNPKVFEFAKEIGMTPLALMDKIREWNLPVKSHMAELSPDVLTQIKSKLSVSEAETQAQEAKPKKTAARRSVKKAAAPAEDEAAPVKTPVIRRKKEDIQAAEAAAAAEAPKVKVIAKPAAEGVEDDAAAKPKRVVVKRSSSKDEAAEAAPAATESAETVKAEAAPVPSVKSEDVAVEAKAPAKPVKEEEKVATPAVAEEAPAPARKKEVVVGTSGVSSSTTPAVKRNIIGRMDLSRVQPQGGQNRSERPQGGYQRGAGGDRPAGGQQGGGGYQPRPGGFNRPAGGAPTRNIRPGFVAQSTPEPMPDASSEFRRDFDKRKKATPSAGGGFAAGREREKEKEEEVQVFNPVEFRKREMVFQPKKRKGVLERVAMKTQITTPSAHKRVVKVNKTMKVSDLAMEMGIKAPQLVRVLMQNGVMANMNADLDFDTIALIVPEFGWEAQNVFQTADELAEELAFGDLNAEPVTRPPVVTVMGHVDHGKTSLLDAIRNAHVARGEAGGITQHIGAYSVGLEDGTLITFLDTPGHEAFTAMRARGANATDIAIIVVAADDGMMPQTQEAISHAKAAGVPIIVAVNKMDKPTANPDRIKQQLTELEIVPEEWGGSTIFCEVSALQRMGINELLEQVKLVAEVSELKANPKRSATGIVIEAKMEKGKGPVATLLVKDGTIEVGQYIVAGSVKGRVRSLMNDKGERVDSVGPGLPVEVLGLDAVPSAGDKFDVVKDEETANKVSTLRKEQAEKAEVTPNSKMSLEDIFSKVKAGDVKELAIVLKADVHGTLEAISGMLNKLSTSEVKARIIHSAVGGVSESDVVLAHTAKGVVIGFNVRPDLSAQAKAKQMGVDIRTYSVVYELIDQIKAAMEGLLSPDVVEEVMGRAEVRNTFSVPKVGVIAGCFVLDGKVQRNNMIRLLRDNKIIYEGKIGSLKRFKDDAREVASGYECGIGIENYNDVKVGDMMEAFIKKEVARELGASN
ncbi:translation initiation factor IF-2 [Bdellovibrio bacteriovorus W]|nr:translation initiation factor IF-2 [Bdellovibrio bacteriovorus W]